MNNLVTLKNLFHHIKPNRTLETGMAYGGSALLFTACHREAGISLAGQHTAVDPFETVEWDDVGLVAVENAGLRGYLDYRDASSGVALPRLIAEGAVFELIYIDGSHLFEDVFIDFYFSTRLLVDGGVVLFDDSSHLHVQKLLRFIRSNFRFAYEPFDLSPFRADKGAGLRYRAAKVMGRTQLTAFRKIGPATRHQHTPFASF